VGGYERQGENGRMKQYLLGIDIGTSSVKALLVDTEGNIAAKTSREYPLSSPAPLWSEQDPEDWWQGTRAVIAEFFEQSSLNPAQIVAVGLTGQMHGLVLLDAAGKVLRPAMLWNDQRTGEQCERIHEAAGRENVIRITGKPALASFTAPKILWVREREPEIYARIATCLLPKDYIRYRLTGTFFSDVADASGMSLLDVGARRWSDEMLRCLEIPEAFLPQVTESTDISAFVNTEAAAATGLLAGTPIVGGAGDQAAEAVGCGVLEEGKVSIAIGTSGVVFAGMPSYVFDPLGRLHAYCHASPGLWHVMGVMLSAGGSYRWLRDTFCAEEVEKANYHGIDVYDLMSEYADAVAPGCEGLLFLPYLSGERTPYPDPYARGVFFGISLRHGRKHFIRSVLEGVAFGLKDSMELLAALNLPVSDVRISGGGARSSIWRQIIADVLNVPLHIVNATEGAAFGAALLAGVGAGVFPSVRHAASQIVRIVDETRPGPGVDVYRQLYPRYRALYSALKDEFRALGSTVDSMARE
jgi:xylulokinase